MPLVNVALTERNLAEHNTIRPQHCTATNNDADRMFNDETFTDRTTMTKLTASDVNVHDVNDA